MWHEKAYVAALIGGNRFLFCTVMRDDALIAELIEREIGFWEGHVLTDICPEVDGAKATGEYLDGKYRRTVPDVIKLPGNMKKVLLDYEQTDRRIKDLEKEKQELSNKIKSELKEHEGGEVDGMTVKWKRIERESIDSKRMKKEKPELFLEYRNISAYRRLLVAS